MNMTLMVLADDQSNNRVWGGLLISMVVCWILYLLTRKGDGK